MRKVNLYKGKASPRDKEICLTFYEGNYTVLYSNHLDDESFKYVFNRVHRGLKDENLLSQKPEDFFKNWEFIETITLGEEDDS